MAAYGAKLFRIRNFGVSPSVSGEVMAGLGGLAAGLLFVIPGALVVLGMSAILSLHVMAPTARAMAERAGCAASLMALSESSQFLPVRPLPVVLRDEMA